jgi:transcriptional regulator with XRE-family HTH domain
MALMGNWTSREAAEYLGLSTQSVSRYLGGTQQPTLESVRLCAEKLNWSILDQISLLPPLGKGKAGIMIYGMKFEQMLCDHFGGVRIDAPRARTRGSGLMIKSAQLLGTNTTAVQAYVQGRRYPTVSMMHRIANRLGWPAAEQIQLIPEDDRNPEYGEYLTMVLEEHFAKEAD